MELEKYKMLFGVLLLLPGFAISQVRTYINIDILRIIDIYVQY